jgi:putative flippase GtrA
MSLLRNFMPYSDLPPPSTPHPVTGRCRRFVPFYRTFRTITELYRKHPIFGELLRYLISGGIAFLVDFFTLLICVELFVPEKSGTLLYLFSIVSFAAGFMVNYFLSFLLVFTKARYGRDRISVLSFFVFVGIAIAGLGLTELGMFAGVALLKFNYIAVKIVVSLIVLLWNYGARRIFLLR